MGLDIQYKNIVENLRLLALPINEQRALLPNFVVVEDEMINSFFEAFLLLPQLIENEYLSFKSIAAILRLYNRIEISSPNMKNEELDKIRLLAQNALTQLGEQLINPDLNTFTWISK